MIPVYIFLHPPLQTAVSGLNRFIDSYLMVEYGADLKRTLIVFLLLPCALLSSETAHRQVHK